MKKNVFGLLLAIAKQNHARAKGGNKTSWKSVINRLSR